MKTHGNTSYPPITTVTAVWTTNLNPYICTSVMCAGTNVLYYCTVYRYKCAALCTVYKYKCPVLLHCLQVQLCSISALSTGTNVLYYSPVVKHYLQYNLSSSKWFLILVWHGALGLVLKHSSLTLEHRMLGMGSNEVRNGQLWGIWWTILRQVQIAFIILSSHLSVLHQITFPFFLYFLLLFFLSFIPSHLLSYTFYISVHDLSLAAEKLERDTVSKNLHLPYQHVY